MSAEAASAKPRVLICGGVGFIGRNLVKYLVDNDLCSFIRVADKRMSVMSYLSAAHRAAFDAEVVEEKQADLSNDAHIARVFAAPEAGPFDFCIVLAAETKHGQPDAVYQQKTVDVATKTAAAAAAAGIKRLVYASTAHVYKSQAKKPATESAALEPWTSQATFMLAAEKALAATEGLDYVVARPGIVYGPGDVEGLMPRCVCAATYRYRGEKMLFLWDKNLSLSTVHVADVVAALWHLCTAGSSGDVFNLADAGETDQGRVNEVLGGIFGIETGFQGKMMSNLARIKMTAVVQHVNDVHLTPWLELLKTYAISNTPLSPFIDKELLLHNHLYVDGTAIEATGFSYKYPALDAAEVRACVLGFIEQKLFPPVLPGMAREAAEGKGAEEGDEGSAEAPAGVTGGAGGAGGSGGSGTAKA